MKDLLHFNLEEKNCLYDKSTNICIQLHIACMLMTEMQMEDLLLSYILSAIAFYLYSGCLL